MALYLITGLFGITLSFHRNLSHRSFNLPKWLEYFFAYCGVQAMQGNPIDWVSTHSVERQIMLEIYRSNPSIDFFKALMLFIQLHLGFCYIWCEDFLSLSGECLSGGGSPRNAPPIDLLAEESLYGQQNPHILGSSLKQSAVNKTHHPVDHFKCGQTGYVAFVHPRWTRGVRIVWVYHITWLVNSACYVWGNQAWDTKDLSKNNWWVAELAFGEGWHNNHHAFEFSARHGLQWWQLDITWYVIRLLQVIGLATYVKLPSEIHKQRMSFSNETTAFCG
ncbi:hypothetical protein BVC80_8479g5 [Macleaya cordata]|uniref:Fatty acid desaturase n=1 Tax=Macleaya cordata TaxID=56857 RepID=A0A200QR81_MACCD|nr:hypothetical protein BVC80_8479g5 [Macleaya cordata]